jgi:hypothetical protein
VGTKGKTKNMTEKPKVGSKAWIIGLISVVVAAVLGYLANGCSVLAPAKEPAREVWYAAELLCEQDLEQYAQVQAISGAAQLIEDVCSSVEVARPYVELLLREDQVRGGDPRAVPRANAQRMLVARRSAQ